tara:strand:+ start:434 stop:880 length:447 start_codon:yes stop_codon:yes gene_type:complete
LFTRYKKTINDPQAGSNTSGKGKMKVGHAYGTPQGVGVFVGFRNSSPGRVMKALFMGLDGDFFSEDAELMEELPGKRTRKSPVKFHKQSGLVQGVIYKIGEEEFLCVGSLSRDSYKFMGPGGLVFTKIIKEASPIRVASIGKMQTTTV